MEPDNNSAVLAYKGLGHVPTWLQFGIVVVAFVIFAVQKRKGR
ncbi:hypothetical protein [Streptomyces sp. NPDC007172]